MNTLQTRKHYMGKDAHKDWAIIVIITCLVSIILVVVGLYSYKEVSIRLIEAETTPAETKLPYDPKDLEAAIKVLDQSTANQELILKNDVGVKDPSI